MEDVKLKIDASFWLMLGTAVLFKRAFLALCYCLAVFLHEMAHFVVANSLFYRTKHIQLGMFGAVLYGDFADVHPNDAIKIALAGPICNATLCLACLALWWIAPPAYVFTEDFFLANASMGCVNLLPCYPLDGGRIAGGVLQKMGAKHPVVWAKRATVAVGLLGLALFVVSVCVGQSAVALGVFSLCLLLGVFSKTNGQCYARTSLARSGKYFAKKGMEKKTLVFQKHNILGDVVKRMQGNYLYDLHIVDSDLQLVCTLSIAQLEKVVVSFPIDTPLWKLVGYGS
ncbi:MAG: hypothetical protein IJD18_03590 [Clostridia bacterium]|nr:hypothetical protein [Clostridia bacterium]